MEVILIKDSDNLGAAGSVVKVKDGFARNFLLPRKLAIPATPANLKKIEDEKKRAVSLKQRQKEKALQLSQRLSGMSITIPAATYEEDKLYGSIGAANISEALNQEGISEIAKEAVVLDEPIKSTGVYEVELRLHPEVSAKLKVWVVNK